MIQRLKSVGGCLLFGALGFVSGIALLILLGELVGALS